MKNMALTKEERKSTTDVTSASETPKYPWGLGISLDELSLTKLGAKELPTPGMKLTLEAIVVVESVREEETVDGGSNRNVSLQITDMSLGENPDDKRSRHAGVLYTSGKK